MILYYCRKKKSFNSDLPVLYGNEKDDLKQKNKNEKKMEDIKIVDETYSGDVCGNSVVSGGELDERCDIIDEDEDSNFQGKLLYTPNTYLKQKDEFYDDKKKNIKSFLIKARRCDPPHDSILGDKRRTLNAIFSEIQVLLYYYCYFILKGEYRK
jgi:hypothetical protein